MTEKWSTERTVVTSWLSAGVIGLVASYVMKWEGSFWAAFVLLAAGLAGVTSVVYNRLLSKKDMSNNLRIALVVFNFLLTVVLVYLLGENLLSSLIDWI